MNQLEAIRYYLKVAETLSFKATASHFGVASSKVSRAIKSLEQSLGASLVERTTRRVRLTQTGEWYRNEVTEPLRAIAAANEMAHVQSKAASGTIRLTALSGYGEIRLLDVLKRFRAEYPKIVCDVEFTDRYLDLSTGEIDIALRATASPPDYLVAKRLHAHHFILVASPSYLSRHGRPKVLADLERHAALAYRGPTGVFPWLAQRTSGDFVTSPRSPSLITNHGLSMLHAAIEGEGLALLPQWSVSEVIATGQLEEIKLEDAQIMASAGPKMSMFILYAPEKARLGKIHTMVDFLREHLSDKSK